MADVGHLGQAFNQTHIGACCLGLRMLMFDSFTFGCSSPGGDAHHLPAERNADVLVPPPPAERLAHAEGLRGRGCVHRGVNSAKSQQEILFGPKCNIDAHPIQSRVTAIVWTV